MRKSLRSLTFVCGSLLFSALSQAQDGFAYAITDMPQQHFNWSYLRKLDLKTGQFSEVILNGNDQSITAFDAGTRKQLGQPLTDARFGQLANAAFGTGVAALALDKKNGRLYYTPMFIDQLRYIDLKTMKVFYVTGEDFTGKPIKSSDQGNIVTRMVIASDGNGYAMTNDGMQLMRFSTGKNISIVDLGPIADDQANSISIHSSCSSYGGDMIADDNGNLYVFSARNNVFRVNIESKVATHLGYLKGLPANFTVNGAAVMEDNKVLVGSATLSGTYFTVDMKNLSATPYSVSGGALQSSDLANSNLLVSGNRPKVTEIELLKNKPVNLDESKVSIYPNPVTDNQFVVQFGELEPGTYTVQVTDGTGRQVIQQVVNISGINQSQLIKLNAASSRSVYMVKVLNSARKMVYSTKVIVQ